jgi:histidyl-tRNA synthetase
MAEKRAMQGPKGTRDYYPAEMLRRRYIEGIWRAVSIRHGFEEIDGPTFEPAELYTVKSGEGILGEMFGVFSGKSDEDVRAVRETGQAPYGLRPEFTPTLARMYAARAPQLPKPTKWFTVGPFFRAERPQRGRLREFLQWNVDFLGGEDSLAEKASADAEVIACCVDCIRRAGLTASEPVTVRISHRAIAASLLAAIGVSEQLHSSLFGILDRKHASAGSFRAALAGTGLDEGMCGKVMAFAELRSDKGAYWSPTLQRVQELADGQLDEKSLEPLRLLEQHLVAQGVAEWCSVDFGIVRGLAYYTGTVFEVHAGAERAVAGGGRYDDLVALFGGPSTPAVGFGMGDVVLGLLIEPHIPTGRQLLESLSTSHVPRYRPDVVVIGDGSPEAASQVPQVFGRLRATTGFHVRRSYRATSNLGKLVQAANAALARVVVQVNGDGSIRVQDLDRSDAPQHVSKDTVIEVLRKILPAQALTSPDQAATP